MKSSNPWLLPGEPGGKEGAPDSPQEPKEYLNSSEFPFERRGGPTCSFGGRQRSLEGIPGLWLELLVWLGRLSPKIRPAKQEHQIPKTLATPCPFPSDGVAHA